MPGLPVGFDLAVDGLEVVERLVPVFDVRTDVVGAELATSVDGGDVAVALVEQRLVAEVTT